MNVEDLYNFSYNDILKFYEGLWGILQWKKKKIVESLKFM